MADTEPKPGAEPSASSPERHEGNGKARSETAYPYYGLSHAIEMVQAIRKTGGKDASLDAVMKEMGIPKPTDRRWAYGVPSAVLYGLVERIGRGETGRLKVTELALRLTNPASPEAGRNAKIAALKTPDLYSKLLEKFAGAPQPTREGLKNLLFTDYGIVESMAMMAADAFLDAIKTAEVVTPSGEINPDMGTPPTKEKARETPPPPERTPASGMQIVEVPGDFIIYRAKISGGKVLNIPLPPKLRRADVEKLHAFLETQIDDETEEVTA
jgi:hypothetical protein